MRKHSILSGVGTQAARAETAITEQSDPYHLRGSAVLSSGHTRLKSRKQTI